MLLLARWLVYALAMLLAASLLPGVHLEGFGAALLAALVLGIINAVLRPLLLLLTLPITLLTLGLFALVINTLMIMLADALLPGLRVEGFLWALLFGLVLSLIHFILGKITLGRLND